MKTHFSDFFEIDPGVLDRYGAFNISLINDLPLFIDPFLLFNSKKPEYTQLHTTIINYLIFLRDRSSGRLDRGHLQAWYTFPEVRENWLGFCTSGNRGSGLGTIFANALHQNLSDIFRDFGNEKITQSSHLEKLCLIKEGVGRDNISDFTTNLIKEYLLNYTEKFAKKYIKANQRKRVAVERVRFNYVTETWAIGEFELPYFGNNYIILTPRDILTKDDIWINKRDLYNDYNRIPSSIPNEQLRAQIDNYFRSRLSEKPDKQEFESAVRHTALKFPELLDYYIKYKEEHGDKAQKVSLDNVSQTEQLFIKQIKQLIDVLSKQSKFYDTTYAETYDRLLFLKDVIENKDGYKLFYMKGEPIKRESDLQILFRLTWFATISDVNREVNNGRGPVDFKISRSKEDATLVEFKLASNTHLEKNLRNQVAIYEKASDTNLSIKAILYFSDEEFEKIQQIIKNLKLENASNLLLIDARPKKSASKV